MSRKGKNQRKWNQDIRDGKYYYEHDDRMGDGIRRVSYKGSNNRISKHGGRQRDWDVGGRARLVDDDDIDMVGAAYSSGRHSGRNRSNKGRNRVIVADRPGKSGHYPQVLKQQKLCPSPVGLYRVIVPFGGKYEKTYILSTMANYISPTPLVPIAYKVSGQESSFFLEDFQAVEKLHAADRKITLNDGFKMIIKIHRGIPSIDLSPANKELMKAAMVKRYNPMNKALNLSKFYLDPELQDKMLVALFRANILLAVIDIIAENIPELVALNLAENKIQTLDGMRVMGRKLPNLKILHLDKNKIRDTQQLDHLQNLKLEDLVLDGNPVCDKFQDRSTYISEIRKRFPKVIKLDGIDLPPPIMFDAPEEASKLPPSRTSFSVAPENVQLLVQTFLEQYYSVYDSDNRQGLMDAYHDSAVLSLTAVYPPNQNASSTHRLNEYFGDSRNLLRISDLIRRRKLLHQGKLDVISCLSKLPKSRHLPHTFVMDLALCTAPLIQVSVSGMFSEPGLKSPPMRSFTRIFVIIPTVAGLCITNDMMVVSNATSDQIKAAEKVPPPPVAENVLSDAVKEQMVLSVVQQTGMNIIWSKKCLEETNWDLAQAVHAFSELNNKQAIPAEAFIH